MSAVLSAVVRLTPTVKTDWVSVTPTTPRPSTGRKSLRSKRLSGSTRRRSSQSNIPANVKRTAANRIGGTLSTTCLTATKLVPKKKTVRSSEVSTHSEARRFSTLANEVRILVEGLHVGGDQARAVLQVLQVHDLVRRVHVAIGARDEPRRYPGPGEVDGVGVGSGRARVALQSVGDLLRLSGGDEAVGDGGAQDGGPGDHGTTPEGVVAMLVLGDARGICRVGHVHGYRGVGIEAEGGAARAVEPDLLLHARHRNHLGGHSVLCGEQAQGFKHDEGAHPVVQRARGDAAVGELEEVLIQDPNVSDPDHLLRLIAVIGADVYPEVLYLGDLLALLGFHEVNGLLADDAGDFAIGGLYTDPLAHEHLRVPAAHAGKVEEALLVYVGDHEPDLVYVPAEHHPGRPTRVQRGKRVAHPVPPDLGELLRLLPPDFCRRRLVAARPRRGE